MNYPTVVDSFVPGKKKNVDTRGLNSRSTNNCRLTKGAKSVIRVPSPVGLTSGESKEAKRGVNQHPSYSHNEMRRLASKVLRDRGIEVNDRTIAGILSGATL